MSAIDWRAEGIERGLTAGGVVLERYFRPGFQGGPSVRRAGESGARVEGFVVAHDLGPEDDDREDHRRRR